jgi:nitrite reductase/ring-hydroxylating ferredoxin subunit
VVWIDLGPADLREGDARVVPVPGAPAWQTVVVTRAAGGWRGYWNLCRHLPIPLDAGLGRLPPGPELVCSTHGARFRARDGLCVAGPCAGKSLHHVRVEEREGVLWAHLEGGPPSGAG